MDDGALVGVEGAATILSSSTFSCLGTTVEIGVGWIEGAVLIGDRGTSFLGVFFRGVEVDDTFEGVGFAFCGVLFKVEGVCC